MRDTSADPATTKKNAAVFTVLRKRAAIG